MFPGQLDNLSTMAGSSSNTEAEAFYTFADSSQYTFSHPCEQMVEKYYNVTPPARPEEGFLEERKRLFAMRKGFGLVEGWHCSDVTPFARQLLTYAR